MTEIDKESQYGEVKIGHGSCVTPKEMDDTNKVTATCFEFSSILSPDYLSFVDDDIRAMFNSKSYENSDILMAQLIKEIRKLNANLQPESN